MADIRRRVGIAAPAERVYQALATSDGLSRWWTREVRGDAEPGGKLEFFFGTPEPAAVMEVTDLVPDRRKRTLTTPTAQGSRRRKFLHRVISLDTLMGSGSAPPARFRASDRPAPTAATRTRVHDSRAFL